MKEKFHAGKLPRYTNQEESIIIKLVFIICMLIKGIIGNVLVIIKGT